MVYDKPLRPIVPISPSASAYAPGKVIGGALTFFMEDSNTESAVLGNVLVVDDGGIGPTGELWLFRKNLATPIADNVAFNMVFLDWDNFICSVVIDPYTGTGILKKSLTKVNRLISWKYNSIIGYFVSAGSPDWNPAAKMKIIMDLVSQ